MEKPMLFNGTPHEVTIYAEADCTLDSASRKLILKENATAVFKIPAGTPLNAKTQVSEIYDSEFPFLRGAVEFVDADPLPGMPGDIVIVSNLYRSALKELSRDTGRIATVGGTVYENIKNPRPVGCLWLNVG